MNADRRKIAGVLGVVTMVMSAQRSVPQKLITVLYDETKALAETERLSLRKMESFKDSPSTAVNYRNAAEAYSDLQAAVEALSEGELDEAFPLLLRVALPLVAEPTPQATPTRKKARRA